MLIAAALQSFAAPADSSSADAASAERTVQAYHEALVTGDSNAALSLLADDVVILESGERETRDEYRTHHLAADIEFAQTVPSVRDNITVTVEGDVAWVTSSSRATGAFRGRTIDSNGVELMVLSRTTTGWVIRAIHWSAS